jgi:pimeloyl-ACP methyl ester carboxylesterase
LGAVLHQVAPSVPTAAGGHGRSWPVEGARYIAKRIPAARLVELEGGDHFPFAGDVDALIDEVESFLTGARPARPAADSG